MLMVAATGSLIIAGSQDDSETVDFIEGIAIFVIVILNAGIAAVTENAANSALDALKKMSQATCQVIRDGTEQPIASVAVVKGDLVVLGTGDVEDRIHCRI